MKNIETIIKEAGIELSDDQIKKINEGVKDNYKTIADYQKQIDKIKALEGSVEETQTALKKFEGVDPEDLTKQIKTLQETIEKNSKDYEARIADRDFTDLLTKAITEHKGINQKAIMALLDVPGLKESKNQQADIEAAVKKLTEAEDSKMLFGAPDPENLGKGNPIGTVKKDAAPGLTGVEKAFFERTGVKLD